MLHLFLIMFDWLTSTAASVFRKFGCNYIRTFHLSLNPGEEMSSQKLDETGRQSLNSVLKIKFKGVKQYFQCVTEENRRAFTAWTTKRLPEI